MKAPAVFILIISLLAASCSRETADSSGMLSIVAVDFPSYDAARAITRGRAELRMLLPPGTESHSYDPTPRDMVLLSECDLVVYAGGPSDIWVDSILSSIDTPPQAFALTDQVDLLAEDHMEGMEEGKEHGHAHSIDEHVWTSPVNEMRIISSLSDTIASLDPGNARYYAENAAGYIGRISDLDQRFREIVSEAGRHVLIFASRFPLLYFAREYGLECYAAFPGCAEETEPSARTVAFLIDKAKELHGPCVLNIEMSSAMLPSLIASEAGCGVRTFNTLHNVSAADFRSGKDYVDLMEENISVLEEALH